MTPLRALLDATALAREARRQLPICSPGQAVLPALLVRSTELEVHGTADEQLAHALALREAAARFAPPQPQAPVPTGHSDPLLAALDAVNPAEGEWLRAARARHAEYLRAVAEARTGQALLTAQAPAPDRPRLPSTIDRPALQRGLWEAA